MRKKPWSGMRKPKKQKQNKEYLLYCKINPRTFSLMLSIIDIK